MSKKFPTEDLAEEARQAIWKNSKIEAARRYYTGEELEERLKEIERESYWGWSYAGNCRLRRKP